MLTNEQMDHWLLEEDAFEAYERYLVPRFFAPGAQFLIEAVELQAGERVLDIACATGSVARFAAPRVGLHGKVVGLDINDGMLAMAGELSVEILPEIVWRKGDALAIPFPENSFDVVFCQQGLQFFPDWLAALHEMHRVLAPNGRLALSVLRSLRHNPAYDLLVMVLDKHGWADAAALMQSPFPELSAADLRSLITGAGFREARLLLGIDPVRYPSAREFLRQEVVATRAVLPKDRTISILPDGLREALIHDLEKALDVYTDDDGIVFPTETYLVTARK